MKPLQDFIDCVTDWYDNTDGFLTESNIHLTFY
jgi:hypothetical protein